MKKYMSIMIMVLICSMSHATDGGINELDKKTVKEMSENERLERVQVLEERILELESTDLKSMPAAERRETKKELRYIQKEMKAHSSHGVYISTAGLVIIILLAIIIF